MLDIGCGQGLYSCILNNLGFSVTGVDLDKDLIEMARKNAVEADMDIQFEVAPGDNLPFPDGSFDVVFSNSLLEHVPDWEACVAEWVRVLAAGGLLWIETTNVIHPRQREFRWLPVYSWWPKFLKNLAVKAAAGPFPALANYTPWPAIHWFSYFQLRDCLSNHGLSVRDRFDCMDITNKGRLKRSIRDLAVSSELGRRFAYLLVGGVIVLGRKPKMENGEACRSNETPESRPDA